MPRWGRSRKRAHIRARRGSPVTATEANKHVARLLDQCTLMTATGGPCTGKHPCCQSWQRPTQTECLSIFVPEARVALEGTASASSPPAPCTLEDAPPPEALCIGVRPWTCSPSPAPTAPLRSSAAAGRVSSSRHAVHAAAARPSGLNQLHCHHTQPVRNWQHADSFDMRGGSRG